MPSLFTLVPLFVATAYGLSVSSKLGCFDNSGSLRNTGEYIYNSQGYCVSKCSDAGYSIAALQDANCWCGDDAPTTGQLENDACNTACPGYAPQTCGGDNAWTYLQITPSGKKSSTTSSTSDVSSSTPLTSSSIETSPSSISSAAPLSFAVLNSTAVAAATPTTQAPTGTPTASSTPITYTGNADRFLASFDGVLKSLLATAFAAAFL
ncbi:hypothetical protein K490DRAFT_63668 [Saccharata proteae CBS 121410]|uniref:WSC domain-containing protein n=1 Tax=Saccharata proteae CBS 121410 TaxID=1314787 RepID=A0A6A5YF32_9PEZI|nr:hypothetical protein K490DRAFT_63668 [Saccharata proteae CBS 121410]